MAIVKLILGVGHLAFEGPVQGSADTHSFVVPDTATRLRVEIARCTSAEPDLWPEGMLSWHLYQEELTATHYHGNSVAQGGVLIGEDGIESAWSWDETPLKPGRDRTVHVVLDASTPVRTRIRVTAL